VRDTQLGAGSAAAVGVGVQDDGETGARGVLRLSASVVEGNQGMGVGIAGSDATIEATVVRDTVPGTEPRSGRGIDCGDGKLTLAGPGRMSLRSSLVERSRSFGVVVKGGDATIERTVVREVEQDGAGEKGIGITVSNSEGGTRGALTVRESLIEKYHEMGVFVLASDGLIESSIVRDGQPIAAGVGSSGVAAYADPMTGEPAGATLRSTLLERNAAEGVFAIGSNLTIEGSVVRDTQPTTDGIGGYGLEVHPNGAGRLSLRTSLIERNRGTGVLAIGGPTLIEDCVVRDTLPDAIGQAGFGLLLMDELPPEERSSLLVRTSVIENNRTAGVYVVGADVSVEGSIVRDTQSDEHLNFGRGINVRLDVTSKRPSNFSMRGGVVERNFEVGVLVQGAMATISDSVVRSSQIPAGGSFGDGIVAVSDGILTDARVRDTEVVSNARVGILYLDATGDLSRVRASGNVFGGVFQGSPQPTLGQGVLFEGNTEQDTIIDGDLPVPDAAPLLP
jgi:hypothetical protein